MKIGFIGLGKMGSQMVQRLMNDGHEVIVYDLDQSAVDSMVAEGAEAAIDQAHTVDMLHSSEDKAVIWLMIPHAFVRQTLEVLAPLLRTNDVVIDGGNSDYRDTVEHAKLLSESQVELVDVGTSGGVHGLKNGFSLMVGGSQAAVSHVESLFESLAQPGGYGHFGKTGAGHFTKMVHNGIEYGIMQSFAEGYRIIKEGPFENVDLAKLADVWQHGSINESFLNGLIQTMLARDPELTNVEGVVAESGEARWTLETAQELGIATPAIQASLDVRLASQAGETNYATKFLAQLRNEFGGHAVNTDSEASDGK